METDGSGTDGDKGGSRGETYFKKLVHSLSVFGKSDICGCPGSQAGAVVLARRQAPSGTT